MLFKHFKPLLKTLLDVCKSAGQDSLKTVLFEFSDGNKLAMTATDGHCLFHTNIKIEHNATDGYNVLIKHDDLLQCLQFDTTLDLQIISYDGSLMITDGVITIIVPVSGNSKDFPDFRDGILDREWPEFSGSVRLDNRLFIKLTKSLKPVLSANHEISLQLHGIDAPIFIRPTVESITNTESIVAIVMPYH